MGPPRIDPFRTDVPDGVLSDLRERLRRTRWPPPAPGPAWEQGTDLEVLQRLVAFWIDGFDWRARERELNRFPQFRAEIDGVPIHFVHQRAARGRGVPLIVTHGWPSAFVEILPLVPLLTDPHANGIDGPAFDVVIPSLPGYGFSGRPDIANYRVVASMWHRLMRGLGYERYGAGDFVRVPTGIANFVAHFVPEGDPPREWFERLYAVRRFTQMPRGGHFAAVEEPDLLARDLAAFFAAL